MLGKKLPFREFYDVWQDVNKRLRVRKGNLQNLKKKTLSEKKEVRKFGDVCKDVNKHLRIQKGQPKNMKKTENVW